MDELDEMLLALSYDLDPNPKEPTMNGMNDPHVAEHAQPVPEEAHLPSRLRDVRDTLNNALVNAQSALVSIEGQRPECEPKLLSTDADPDCALGVINPLQRLADHLLRTTNDLRCVVELRS